MDGKVRLSSVRLATFEHWVTVIFRMNSPTDLRSAPVSILKFFLAGPQNTGSRYNIYTYGPLPPQSSPSASWNPVWKVDWGVGRRAQAEKRLVCKLKGLSSVPRTHIKMAAMVLYTCKHWGQRPAMVLHTCIVNTGDRDQPWRYTLVLWALGTEASHSVIHLYCKLWGQRQKVPWGWVGC